MILEEDPPSYILFAILILFILSAFFSASEVALLSVSEAKVRSFVGQKKRGSASCAWLKKHSQKLIITILIGNNLANIIATVLITYYVQIRFGSEALSLATAILTIFVLIFGEIMPKTFAHHHASRFALLFSPILKVFYFIFSPAVFVLEKLSATFIKAKKQLSEEELESELIALAEIGEEGGALEKGEKEIIENVLDFSETQVDEIMTPRTRIDAIDEESTLQEAVDFVITHSHSRIPVFKQSIDNIIGIITIRDLLKFYQSHEKDTVLSEFELNRAFVIPHTRKTSETLKDFQKEKVQIAIIVDEHGGTEGLCTLEDLVEEVFGEIEDESDIQETLIQELSLNSWHVKGKATMEEIEEATEISLDEDDLKSVSLLILEKLSRFPSQGEKIDFPYSYIIVEKMEENKIEKVRLVKKVLND